MDESRRTVSVCLAVHNEEELLEAALQSVRWADEIVLVDCESTDRTVEIARRFGARVLHAKNHVQVNINKNFAFSQATHGWILDIDGDERVSEALAEEIRRVLAAGPAEAGFWVPRRNIVLGRWLKHGGHYPDYHVRLFKKGAGSFPLERLHVQLGLDGPAGYLENDLLHPNIRRYGDHVKRINEYSDVEAGLLEEAGFAWTRRAGLAYLVGKPVFYFLRSYVFGLGFLDRMPGLLFDASGAWYYFVLGVKLWERSRSSTKTRTG